MLDYDMPLYRPPSEGNNLIIQVTYGCSFNRCSFCAMYKTKEFTPRPLEDVFADIDAAARGWPSASRVFLADGDAMVLPTDHLVRILEKLDRTFPELTRVTSYAMPSNLLKKSPEDLAELKARKLTMVYLGLESGSPAMLRRITKGASPKGIVKAVTKAVDAGLKVSATVVLGLGGRRHWEDHIDGTIDVVNRAPFTYLSTLQLRLNELTETDFFRKFGEPFEWQDDDGVLAEQTRLIAGVNPPRPLIFRSNHASNALPLAGNLPRDRDKLLAILGGVQTGEVELRPIWMREI